jgi:hypothetical protein
VKRRTFLFYSRPLFRTCEIICNHAARIFEKNLSLSKPEVKATLNDLNQKRIEFQKTLNEIGSSHSHVCADCKGKCCGGVRERDAFIDRVLQNPDTPYRNARRRFFSVDEYETIFGNGSCIPSDEAECVKGHCPELTTRGCRIPYAYRPIQCTAYFCDKTAQALSNKECETLRCISSRSLRRP